MTHSLRHPRRALALTALAALALSAAACAQDKNQRRYTPPGQTEHRVETLAFRAVDPEDPSKKRKLQRVNEAELREGLATQEDPGWRAWKVIQPIPILGAEPSYYNTVAWERDEKRILTFYRARGYYNAEIVEVRRPLAKEGEGQELLVIIDEGEPTRVRSLRFEGLAETGIEPRAILEGLSIYEGNIFTVASYQQSKYAIERKLRDRSYAYARVRGRVVVDPRTQVADVVFFIDSGPRATFGDVVIEGLDRVDEEYVRDALMLERGQLYSADALQKTQESIYDLGVFSLVTVQPAFRRDGKNNEEDPTDEVVPRATGDEGDAAAPGALGISELLGKAQEDAAERTSLPREVKILVRVKEAKNWSVQVGAGFAINSTRQDVHAALNLRSRNFFGTLGKLEQFNTFGYALTPGIFQVSAAQPSQLSLDDFGNRGVYFQTQLRYTQPQLFERRTTGFLQGNVERDIQENYIGLIPSASIGLRRPLFTRRLTAEISYNIQYTRYQSFTPDYGDELRAQGLDPNVARPSLLLEYLEQKLIYDGRDSPLNPTRGIRAQLSVQEARSYLAGGEFSFIKPRLQLDGYVPFELNTKYVTAARAGIGSIYNTNDPAEGKGIPLQNRLFAGGKGSVRSFGPRYFGFFTEDLVDPGPIGSITLFEWSVEQRFQMARNLLGVGALWGAVYWDSGTFYEQQLVLDTAANTSGTIGFGELNDDLINSLGAGIYWLTPVGPVRADLAFTLTNLSEDFRYTADPTVVDDLDTPINEARLDERYAAAVQNKLRGFDFYIGIGHSF